MFVRLERSKKADLDCIDLFHIFHLYINDAATTFCHLPYTPILTADLRLERDKKADLDCIDLEGEKFLLLAAAPDG